MSENDLTSVLSDTSGLPAQIDLLAGMVSKAAIVETFGLQHIVTIRVPFPIVTRFDAMAEYSGKSRTRLMVSALESALEQLQARLPKDDLAEIDKIESRICYERLTKQEGGNSDLVSGEVK